MSRSNAQALRRLLARQGTPNAHALEILEDFIDQDKRAGDVIQRLRRLMRKRAFEWAPLDVYGIVHDVTRLMMAEAAHLFGAEFSVQLPAVEGAS